MLSKATTVAEYLASLPADRREAITKVREVMQRNMDRGYRETMSYGMIGWCVPHELYPPGYHCDPKQGLPFAGLASQKNYMSVYLMGVYSDGTDHMSNWFREAWRDTGKKLDMGKCCIRFKKLDDLALDVIGEAIRRLPVKRFIEYYEAAMAQNAQRKASTKPVKKAKAAGKPAAQTGKKSALVVASGLANAAAKKARTKKSAAKR